jgi:hypothetical protein
VDLAAWIIVAASLGFSATLAAYVILMTVSKTSYDAALRQIEKQRQTIDRLLARQFERMTGNDAEQFGEKLGKLVKHKPVEKPD